MTLEAAIDVLRIFVYDSWVAAVKTLVAGLFGLFFGCISVGVVSLMSWDSDNARLIAFLISFTTMFVNIRLADGKVA